jgi:hypothetical protein
MIRRRTVLPTPSFVSRATSQSAQNARFCALTPLFATLTRFMGGGGVWLLSIQESRTKMKHEKTKAISSNPSRCRHYTVTGRLLLRSVPTITHEIQMGQSCSAREQTVRRARKNFPQPPTSPGLTPFYGPPIVPRRDPSSAAAESPAPVVQRIYFHGQGQFWRTVAPRA